MYYHAGPSGLTELRTLRDLIDSGEVTLEQVQQAWYDKWGDWVEDPWVLMVHPTMDEISLTTDLDEAQDIAQSIKGSVYRVDVAEDEILRINEEGYPVCGPTSAITEL